MGLYDTAVKYVLRYLWNKVIGAPGSYAGKKLHDFLDGSNLVTEEEEQRLIEDFYRRRNLDEANAPTDLNQMIRENFTQWWLQNSLQDLTDNNTSTYRSLFTTASTTAPRRDPLILDLNGDGIKTTDVKAGAYFDHDGNGFAEQTGWVSPNDGLLVMDRNNDGIINDGKELFGDQTILNNGQRAANAFEALSDLDLKYFKAA